MKERERVQVMTDSVFAIVRNYEAVKCILPEVVHRDAADLVLLCASFADCGMTRLVSNDDCASSGISPEAVMNAALQNTLRLDPVFTPVVNAIAQCSRTFEEELKMAERGEAPMFILTARYAGAAVLFAPGIADRVAAVVGDTYYAVPSSIDDWIIIPDCIDDDGPERLRGIIRDINGDKSTVPDGKVLSNNLYRYSVTDGFMIAR